GRAAGSRDGGMSGEQRRIGVGVGGLGYWGRNLARTLDAIPGCELRWLCDPAAPARARLARAYPGARVTGEPGELMADPELDAVVLATPVPTHAALAIQAVEAGQDRPAGEPPAPPPPGAGTGVPAPPGAGERPRG